MRTFAQEQNQPQQRVSSGITRLSTAAPPPGQQAHPILHLQRTLGNQAVPRLLQAKPEDLEARSSTKEVTRFAHDFSQIPVHTKSPVSVQAKLTISPPRYIYEQEADRVSEQVISMPEPQLQRVCACGEGCPSVKRSSRDTNMSDCRLSASSQATRDRAQRRPSSTKYWIHMASLSTHRHAPLWSRASATISAGCACIPMRRRPSRHRLLRPRLTRLVATSSSIRTIMSHTLLQADSCWFTNWPILSNKGRQAA